MEKPNFGFLQFSMADIVQMASGKLYILDISLLTSQFAFHTHKT